MRVLFIGDIVGSPGRQIVRDRLADIIEHQHIDLVIANGENSASGFGITPRIAEELLNNGIDGFVAQSLLGTNAAITVGIVKKFLNLSRMSRACFAPPTSPRETLVPGYMWAPPKTE